MELSNVQVGDTVEVGTRIPPYSVMLELERIEDGFKIVNKGAVDRENALTDFRRLANNYSLFRRGEELIERKYNLGERLSEDEVKRLARR